MDPFALQQAARRRTSQLVVLVALAVVATTVLTGLVFTAAGWGLWLAFGDTDFVGRSSAYGIAAFMRRYPCVPAACLAVALAVILVRWVFRLLSLSSGDALMEELGAARVVRRDLAKTDDADASLLRLFNVCEEISIASGLDMPSVWVLENVAGVNALAAGTDPSAAAVCVTRGALRHLTRDELQGVVAHEFSHVLNGDMRLNLRITALIAGITAVASIGAGMLAVFGDGSPSRVRWGGGSSRDGKKGGGVGGLAILVVYVLTAIALWLVGSIGAFFARLVQCAVSRQREFLADAAAAQFTRNPGALANALRLASLEGAVRGDCAFETWKGDVAHMLFSGGVERLFATHPPIAERIRRLCPHGPGNDASVTARVREMLAARRARAQEADAKFAKSAARARGLRLAASTLADEPIQKGALAAVRDPARAGETLLGILRGRAPAGWEGALSASARRTLALRCVNTLRDGASAAARRQWADAAEKAVQEDGVYDSFEVMVMASVRRRLLAGARAAVRVVPAPTLRPVAARVLATVASFGGDPPAGYAAAERKLSLFGPALPPMPEPYDDAESLLAALDALQALAPLAKRELLTALREAIAQDGVVTDEEADYLAAVADAIGAYGWLQIQVRGSSAASSRTLRDLI